MAATSFPYGFPTGYSRPYTLLGRLWPRCVNAEPGTFGHECGTPALFIGTRPAIGFQACFCADCKERGQDARQYGHWQALEMARLGAR